MPSTAQVSEALSAQATSQVAAAYLTTATYLELAELWADVGSGAGAAVKAGVFVARAAKVLALRRQQVAQINVANLRLQRALRVGEVVRLPNFDGSPRKARATTAALRQEFRDTVRRYAPEALKDAPVMPSLPSEVKRASMPDLKQEYTPYRLPASAPSEGRVLREVSLPSLEASLRKLDSDLEKATTKGLRELAQANLKRMSADADEGVRKSIVRSGQFGWAGARVLGDRVDQTVAQSDPRVVAYARVHYSFDGNGPCGFCAMLLSRGAVYKSKASAGGSFGSVAQFHPNCRCKGECLYEGENYDDIERFASNRFFDELWTKVVRERGLSGREATRAFRRAVDGMNRRGGIEAAQSKEE